LKITELRGKEKSCWKKSELQWESPTHVAKSPIECRLEAEKVHSRDFIYSLMWKNIIKIRAFNIAIPPNNFSRGVATYLATSMSLHGLLNRRVFDPSNIDFRAGLDRHDEIFISLQKLTTSRLPIT
jgi:hypothetical protein